MFYQRSSSHSCSLENYNIWGKVGKPPGVLFTPQEFWVFKDLESNNKGLKLEKNKIELIARDEKSLIKLLLGGDFSKQTTKFYFATLNCFKHFEIRDWDFCNAIVMDNCLRVFISRIYFEGSSLSQSGAEPARVRRGERSKLWGNRHF